MKVITNYEYPCGMKKSVVWYYWFSFGYTKGSPSKCPEHKYKCKKLAFFPV